MIIIYITYATIISKHLYLFGSQVSFADFEERRRRVLNVTRVPPDGNRPYFSPRSPSPGHPAPAIARPHLRQNAPRGYMGVARGRPAFNELPQVRSYDPFGKQSNFHGVNLNAVRRNYRDFCGAKTGVESRRFSFHPRGRRVFMVHVSRKLREFCDKLAVESVAKEASNEQLNNHPLPRVRPPTICRC